MNFSLANDVRLVILNNKKGGVSSVRMYLSKSKRHDIDRQIAVYSAHREEDSPEVATTI